MLKQALINEFMHEAENTRKLLTAIPDAALAYRPQPHLWSIGQLASHIAEVYNWFDATFNNDVFDMGTYKYDKGDLSKAENIVAKFESNVENAKVVLENWDESTAMHIWHMQMGGNDIMPAMPKAVVARSFLYNHLYHHRGELVAHLRAAGFNVPGLYGPTYEEGQAMMANMKAN
jgi:uncharacterized damage-inducible protein DinB